MIRVLLAQRVTAEQLRQDSPALQGMATADVERVRGHLLASLESRAGLDDVVDLVAEELRTSTSPIVLAGAARALRGLDVTAESVHRHDWAALLRGAAERLATSDVFVRWLPGVIDPNWMCTARTEILGVLEQLPAASATPSARRSAPATIVLDHDRMLRARVEDQSGADLTLAELLSGRSTLLALFYTRCTNPTKCSLTITRLARLVSDAGSRTSAVVAMSYDPAYDTPARLRRYGAERGFVFGPRARFVRVIDGWPDIRALLALRVGYGPVTVNEHSRELFKITTDLHAEILDPDALTDPDLLVNL